MLLDKNPEIFLDKDFTEIKSKFSKTSPNVVLCSEPFVKSEFLKRIIDNSDCNIIYLDFDLLYSGYVTAKMIEKDAKVSIYHLDTENWSKSFANILDSISKKEFLVIIDTLNGINNLFEDKNSARFVNASIMLLSASGRTSGSYLIAAVMARRKEGEWVLSPGGRHVLSPKDCKFYYVKEVNDKLAVSLIDKDFEGGS